MTVSVTVAKRKTPEQLLAAARLEYLTKEFPAFLKSLAEFPNGTWAEDALVIHAKANAAQVSITGRPIDGKELEDMRRRCPKSFVEQLREGANIRKYLVTQHDKECTRQGYWI